MDVAFFLLNPEVVIVTPIIITKNNSHISWQITAIYGYFIALFYMPILIIKRINFTM